MRIYPAVHYTMGGLWVDYNLMSTIPGLFVLGEANFSDHGANRLGASALMQGLADGYFIVPYTIGNYLATTKLDQAYLDHPAIRESESQSRTSETAPRNQRANGLSIRSIRSSGSCCGMTAGWFAPNVAYSTRSKRFRNPGRVLAKRQRARRRR